MWTYLFVFSHSNCRPIYPYLTSNFSVRESVEKWHRLKVRYYLLVWLSTALIVYSAIQFYFGIHLFLSSFLIECCANFKVQGKKPDFFFFFFLKWRFLTRQLQTDLKIQSFIVECECKIKIINRSRVMQKLWTRSDTARSNFKMQIFINLHLLLIINTKICDGIIKATPKGYKEKKKCFVLNGSGKKKFWHRPSLWHYYYKYSVIIISFFGLYTDHKCLNPIYSHLLPIGNASVRFKRCCQN